MSNSISNENIQSTDTDDCSSKEFIRFQNKQLLKNKIEFIIFIILFSFVTISIFIK